MLEEQRSWGAGLSSVVEHAPCVKEDVDTIPRTTQREREEDGGLPFTQDALGEGEHLNTWEDIIKNFYYDCN